MKVDLDDLEGLAAEVQRLIKSNKAFLDRVNDEEFDAEDGEEEPEASEEV